MSFTEITLADLVNDDRVRYKFGKKYRYGNVFCIARNKERTSALIRWDDAGPVQQICHFHGWKIDRESHG